MEPIPETHEALEELERQGDVELRGDLQRLTAQAKERMPGLVGVSLGLIAENLVLTYVADTLDTAALDAVQYTDEGPCLEAVRQDDVIQTDILGLMDEGKWLLFAQASAAAGIRSTLSIPFRLAGVVTGGVNLYGDATDTFDGHVDELAALFGAWAPGATANADLSFTSRLEAVKSPEHLRDQAYLDQAIGLLVGARDLDPRTAEDRLETAAARAGVDVFVLARVLAQAFDPQVGPEG
jgi:hypothetical protein